MAENAISRPIPDIGQAPDLIDESDDEPDLCDLLAPVMAGVMAQELADMVWARTDKSLVRKKGRMKEPVKGAIHLPRIVMESDIDGGKEPSNG